MDLDPGLSGRAVRGSMLVQPYLFFDGRCEEALEFYASALGAEVTMVMRYRDAPDPPPPGMIAPGSEGKIMHARWPMRGTTGVQRIFIVPHCGERGRSRSGVRRPG